MITVEKAENLFKPMCAIEWLVAGIKGTCDWKLSADAVDSGKYTVCAIQSILILCTNWQVYQILFIFISRLHCTI